MTSKAARVKGPRAYLFRIETNLWIDQMRRGELNAAIVSTADDSSAPAIGQSKLSKRHRFF